MREQCLREALRASALYRFLDKFTIPLAVHPEELALLSCTILIGDFPTPFLFQGK